MVDTSLVSASTIIRGNISGQGSLRIEGKVRGDVSVSGDVILGAQAQVAGSIQGAVVTVDGAVEGDITATVALSIGSQARVVGDLTAPNIGLEEGAMVRGRIETDGSGTPAPRARTASTSSSIARPSFASPTRRIEPARPTVVVAKPQVHTAPTVKPEVPVTAKPDLPKAPLPKRDVPAQPVTRVAPPPPAPVTARDEEATNDAPEARAPKKQPPPPVVTAPRKGAKGRKKAAKREA